MGKGSQQGEREILEVLAQGCLRMKLVDSLANGQGNIVWVELCQQPGVEGSL